MKAWFGAILTFSLFLAVSAAHASSPHYINGTLGIKAGSLPESTGLYYAMFNTNYYANSIRDNDGNKITEGRTTRRALDFYLDAFIQTHNLTWATKRKILGARLSMTLSVPLVYSWLKLTDASDIPFPSHFNLHGAYNKHEFGMSDIILEPFVLSWNKERFDLALAAAIYLPTGHYDQNDPTSVGKGFWTFSPTFGGTFYFDQKKTWVISALAGYEIHSKQRQTHIKTGDHFHFEWGFSKTLANVWDIGVVGYASWQLKDNKEQVRNPGNHTRVIGVGPGIRYAIPKYKMETSLQSVWEFKARNGPQGNTTTLAMSLLF